MPKIKSLQKKYGQKYPHLNLILAKVVNKSKEFIFSHPEYELTGRQFLRWRNYLRQLKKNVPLAYITGHKEFFALDFYVNKHVLIPRPETELMVEEIIKQIKDKSTTLIDIGTGSGCIAVAVAKKTKIKTIALDKSASALRVAKKNAKRHRVDINFLHGHLLQPLINQSKFLLSGKNHQLIIAANLPYLRAEQFEQEPSIQHEPKTALVSSNNGLGHYEQLLEQIAWLAKKRKGPWLLLLEIDPSQSKQIKQIIKQSLPQAEIDIKKDLAGHNRLVIIKT